MSKSPLAGALLPGLLLAIVLAHGCKNAASSGSPPHVADRGARFELLVLGVAQDGGLPHVGCNKPCCERARREGWQRFPACLGIHDRRSGRLLLIEATPRVEAQLALLHGLTGSHDRGRKPVDAVLITHAHIGHYLGLAHFGKEVASTQGLPVHVSPRMARFLTDNGPWSQLVATGQIALRPFQPGERFSPLEGLWVEAVPVPHRDEYSDTMAYRIFGPNRAVLFVPDVDSWERQPGLLDRLLDGIDIAYLDGTFYDGKELPERIRSRIAHPPIVDSMQRLSERARAHPGNLRFIHLNHTNPALTDRHLQLKIEQAGFRVAEQGERVPL